MFYLLNILIQMKILLDNSSLFKSLRPFNDLGFVPTMGGIHKGHLSLINKSNRVCKITIVSIFVNPKQFNNKQDLKSYPKNIKKDLKILKKTKKVDFVYLPSFRDIYKNKNKSKIKLNKKDTILCAKYRKGHFEGVLDVMERLTKIVKPKKIFMGEKDFQQLSIIKTMVKKLSISVNIISCKTVREADGLAMSSRNKNMTTEERLIAGEINKFMIKVKEIYKNKKIDKVPISIIDELNSLKNCKLEYFEIDNLSKHSSSLTDEGDRIFIACWIGKTRIIDNLALR